MAIPYAQTQPYNQMPPVQNTGARMNPLQRPQYSGIKTPYSNSRQGSSDYTKPYVDPSQAQRSLSSGNPYGFYNNTNRQGASAAQDTAPSYNPFSAYNPPQQQRPYMQPPVEQSGGPVSLGFSRLMDQQLAMEGNPNARQSPLQEQVQPPGNNYGPPQQGQGNGFYGQGNSSPFNSYSQQQQGLGRYTPPGVNSYGQSTQQGPYNYNLPSAYGQSSWQNGAGQASSMLTQYLQGMMGQGGGGYNNGNSFSNNGGYAGGYGSIGQPPQQTQGNGGYYNPNQYMTPIQNSWY